MDRDTILDEIRTPPRRWSPIGALLAGRRLPDLAARVGIRWAKRRDKPFKIGKRLIIAQHSQINEALRRDLDFLIAPINEKRINEVNGGPFILGLDRSDQLVRERRALYSALGRIDFTSMKEDIKQRVKAQLQEAGVKFDALQDFAIPVASQTAADLFGIGSSKDELFREAVRSIFAHTFLNLGDNEEIRQRALKAGKLMHEWFEAELDKRIASGKYGNDLMGHLLDQGQLDKDGIRRTLGGMLVGSIDTTTTAFAKMFCVIATDPSLRARVNSRWRDEKDIYGYCQEALRLWPHNPIVLRQTKSDTSLGGAMIKSGSTVFLWTQAAMLDSGAFPEPQRMLPERPSGAYLHLGAGLHPCAGRVVNQIQLPILVGELLRANAQRNGKLRYAGPFPDKLPVKLDGEQS